MSEIDWKRKLTSRKLWTAVGTFVSMMWVACGGSESEATQVAALIMAGATVIAYIIGEGLTDSANVGGTLEEIQPIQSLFDFHVNDSQED